MMWALVVLAMGTYFPFESGVYYKTPLECNAVRLFVLRQTDVYNSGKRTLACVDITKP